MKLYTQKDIDDYMKDDWVLDLLNPNHRGQSNKWLIDSIPKRMIWADLYEDLLKLDTKKKILDVGSGYSCLTDYLSNLHYYTCLDFLHHDKFYIIDKDWNNFNSKVEYDIIITNDLFPNVDQRLKLFLKKYLPKCKELRTTLTFHIKPYYLKLKRYDGDEIYHWQVADGHYCDLQICQYQYKIINYNAFLFGKSDSIFPNGRTVIRCDFKGDLN